LMSPFVIRQHRDYVRPHYAPEATKKADAEPSPRPVVVAPAVDVTHGETQTTIVAKTHPTFDRDELGINIDDRCNLLTISGTKKTKTATSAGPESETTTAKEGTPDVRPSTVHEWRRSIRLPEGSIVDQISANYDASGSLKITVPKEAERSHVHHISIT